MDKSEPSAFENILQKSLQSDMEFFKKHTKNLDFLDDFKDYCNRIMEEVENYKETGSFNPVPYVKDSPQNNDDVKENLKPEKEVKRRGRPKKSTIPEEGTESETENPMQLINIKQEKISISDTTALSKNDGEMPAPKQLPPRKKRTNKTSTVSTSQEPRITRSRVKKERITEELTKNVLTVANEKRLCDKESTTEVKTIQNETNDNDDVIIEEKPVEVISLDSLKEGNESKLNNITLPISETEKDKNAENESVQNQNINETYVTSNNNDKDSQINNTKIISKVGTPKTVFSPYENSPVKKKIEAFEKLANTKAATVKSKKITSSCIPKFKSSTPKSTSSAAETSVSQKSLSAIKATQQEYRELERKRKEKEAEAFKKREELLLAQILEKKRKREEKELRAQQQRELREKEKLKMLEAQRLKDERSRQLIQEQEEKKQRLREEAEKKRLLAKQRALEEKKKEEEKQMEKLRKEEEEKRKAAEERRKQELQRIEQEKKIIAALSDKEEKLGKLKKKSKPLYLLYPAPRLLPNDCDSDEEFEAKNPVPEPKWTKKEHLCISQKVMFYCGEKFKNTFFCPQPQSVDLVDLFQTVDPKKLKRTSSANWKRPPRYTLMLKMSKFEEEA